MIDAVMRSSADEAVAMCEPDIELTTLFDRLGGPSFRGHQGVREWFARVEALWAFVELRDWKIEEHGDWILVTGLVRMRGRGSPEVLEMEWASAGRIHEGRFATFGVYVNRGEALAAIAEG
jgi:ketosteroid isomerase-like protein